MHTTKRQSSLLLSHTKHGLNKYLKKTNVIIIKKNNIGIWRWLKLIQNKPKSINTLVILVYKSINTLVILVYKSINTLVIPVYQSINTLVIPVYQSINTLVIPIYQWTNSEIQLSF